MGLLDDYLQNGFGQQGLLAGMWPVQPQQVSQQDPVAYIGQILNQNADKNFVQRILKPDAEMNPLLDEYAGPGTSGTHLMASAEVNGKNIVYPHIVQMPDGNLKQLSPNEAIDYAIKNGQYIQFNTPKEAEWFGKNYKRVWGGEFNK